MTAKKNNDAAPTFEESLKKLQAIVERLEQGDVPLDESLRLYEEGVQLSRLCAERLASAELSIKRLTKDLQGNFELLDHDTEG